MSGPAPSMSLTVFAVVLASALLHAGWNAFVRAVPDKLRGMAVMSMGGSALCALALPFVAVPPAEGWPWLGVGFLGGLSTQALIAQANARGELSAVYPLSGGSPIAVTIGSGRSSRSCRVRLDLRVSARSAAASRCWRFGDWGHRRTARTYWAWRFWRHS